MRKFLAALGLAALLSVSFLGTPQAAAVPQATVVENTVAGGMDAAGEVSGTITVNGGTTLSIFWGGTYSAANRFELQEEVGSPGSGAFRRVLRLDTNTANSDDRTTFVTGPNRNAYRVFMSAAGTGDVLVKMTNASLTPNAFDDYRIYTRHFDDFYITGVASATVPDANYFVVGDEAAGTLGIVTVGIEEGGLTMVTDTGSDGVDSMCLGYTTVTNFAGLISDGWMAFEIRVRNNQVTTEIEFGMGLNDTVCALNTNDVPYTASSEELTVNVITNGAFILQDGGATNTDSFTPFSVNAGVEQHDIDTANTAHVYDTGLNPTVNEYDILRVEIDASGDAFFYINGALVFAEFTAVATTATLAGFWWVNSEDGGTTTVTGVIDWWEFIITRPADAT